MRTSSILLAAALAGLGPGLWLRFRLRPAPKRVEQSWPPDEMTIPGFDFAGLSQSQGEKGGDYHDVFVPPGAASMAVAVGDVAGHDAQAARLKAVARELVRAQVVAPGQLAGLMESVNRGLTGHMKAGRFMTLFLAVMMGASRSIHWVSAGHGPVIAYDPIRDTFDEVPGSDIPLGIDSEWRYHESDHTGWAKGALLVVGTDGVWESRNPKGEMYGKDRLCQVVRSASRASAAAIVRAVADDLAVFRQGRPAGDDVTLVVVKAV